MKLFLQRLRNLLPKRRRQEDQELDEELRAIAEMAEAEGGEARRALGNLALAKENARAVSTWEWLEGVAADVRYAVRVLRKDRSFTFVMLATLALCIGANAAIFTLVDAVLVKSLPVAEPERLVEFGGSSASYMAWRRYEQDTRSWMSGVLASAGTEERDFDTGGGTFRGYAELVTGNYFEVLGVRAARGRLLTPEDDRRDAPAHVAVVSDRFWRSRLGGQEDVLGRTVTVQGSKFIVVGVAPREFFGVSVGDVADVWIPLSLHAAVFPNRQWLDEPNTNFLWIVGRLEPGVTAAVAADALTPLMHEINLARGVGYLTARDVERIRKERMKLRAAEYGVSRLRARFSQPLRVLFWMVGIALTLGCVNLLNLQLARARERQPEIALRLALGARRMRVVRQLFVETALVTSVAAGLGLLLSQPAARGLASFIAQRGQTIVLQTEIDAGLLWFVCALAVAAALVTGLLPALRATGGALAPVMQSAGRATTAQRSRRWVGRTLLAVQVALSLMLVAGASLFGLTLFRLLDVDLGVNRARLAIVDVDVKEAGYKGPQTLAAAVNLAERFRRIPGVEAVSYSHNGLFSGRNSSNVVGVEGFVHRGGNDSQGWFDAVGPRYFQVVGAKLIAGRDFVEADRAGARVAVISEAFAKHFFGDANPIGRNVYVGREKTVWQVVGVVGDMRVGGPRGEVRRWMFLPAQQADGGMWSVRMLVRTAGRPEVLFGSFRHAVQEQDARLPVVSMHAATDLLHRTMDRDRLLAHLSGAFGVLSLLIAAVGVYGLLSFEVARRTHEVGVRVAMGARRPAIVRMVLSETVLLCVAGVVVGTAAALACGRFVQSLLFGLEPNHAGVLIGAAVVLVAVAVGAALGPAWRAASVDPVVALRHE